MVYPRKGIQFLNNWKSSPSRKPLIIRGARQVGKSTLVREFSRGYQNYIPLDMERLRDAALFGAENDIKDIVQAIFFSRGIPLQESEVLLFIDEIQESPRAIEMLRFFYEEYPWIHVIAAGSLLEFAMKEIARFPVGRVAYFSLHPCSFDEFLVWKGLGGLASALEKFTWSPAIHEVLLHEFHQYAAIGGMPEAMKVFLEEKDVLAGKRILSGLWQSFSNDVEKYADNATERKVIRHVMNTAATEKDRVAFAGFGNSNYRSREVGEALTSLHLARVIQLIYPSVEVKPPPVADLRKRPRLQFLDIGLYNFIAGIQGEVIQLRDLHAASRGKLALQLVTQELIAAHTDPAYNPHFWVRESKTSNAEVDLLYAYGAFLIPIEVKAGKSGTLRSLHQFIDRSDVSFGIRLYSGPFELEHTQTPSGKPYRLLNLPYYLASRIPDYVRMELEANQ